MSRWAFACASLITSITVANLCAADDGVPRDKAAAQALFEDGQRLMDAGDYARACPKLAESYKLDPVGGALLNLAHCHQLQGLHATAWEEFKRALAVARSDGREDRVRFATEGISALEPRLSRLTIVVGKDAVVPGLEIVRDQTVLGEPSWGTALPVDPGTHKVMARAPGRLPWETQVTIGADPSSVTVEIHPLAPDLRPVGPRSPTTAPPDRRPQSPAQRYAGWTMVGVGGAAALAGTITGALALVRRSESDDLCATAECPDDASGRDAVALNDQAKGLALSADVLIGAGAGVAVIGLIVALTAPAGEPPSVGLTIAPAPGGALGAASFRF